jgi:hypothetical protein
MDPWMGVIVATEKTPVALKSQTRKQSERWPATPKEGKDEAWKRSRIAGDPGGVKG